MKFAKVLLIAAALSPSVAVAQGTTPPTLPLIPTNFLPLIPVVASFFAVPFVLGDNNDVVPVVLPLPPAPTPTPSTR
ncbi:MAG: hypothetical protein CFE34_00030 [Rhodobacteraceae bacterium PARR1]|nr:MAG: hypothetical protein CFE34_00030 [Rhodobacteraceae bacterium PARR1]